MKKIISLVLLFLVVSCNFSLSPKYDSEILQETVNTYLESDLLYAMMQADSVASYDKYAAAYMQLEKDIQTLNVNDVQRKNGKQLVQMITILNANYLRFEEFHKNVIYLSKGESSAFREEMKAFWKPIIKTELNLLK